MKSRIFLFDIDGTLIDSDGCGRRALNMAFSSLYGATNPFNGYSFAGRTDREIVYFGVAQCTGGRKPSEDDIQRILQQYLINLASELQKPNGYQVHPGVPEILELLSYDDSIQVGLCTGNVLAGARLKLEHANLFKYFSFGGFGDHHLDRLDLTRQAVQLGQERAGEHVPRESIYIIGDTAHDVRCAQMAGATAIAILTGWGDPEAIRALNPDFIGADMTEFMQWLEGGFVR